MKAEALTVLRCPRCGAPLALTSTATSEGEILDGRLACEGCRMEFAVRDGVPRFVGTDNYAGSFGLQWLTHARTQLDSVTGLPISRDRLFDTTGWPRRLDGEVVLEAGSGAGRFTEVLAATGATIYTFDYSRAVEANWANNGRHQHVHVFQADIFAIPVAPDRFDRVVCLGVLQHTPDPARAFRSLAACVRPGGALAIDVYTKSLKARLQWKYLLRPLTTQVDPARLYRWVARMTPPLVPVTSALRRIAGRAGARLSPIVEYAHLGLPPDVNAQWAVLDTFDMYAPAYDLPQSIETVKSWFEDAGFDDIAVQHGLNGVTGRGRRAKRP